MYTLPVVRLKFQTIPACCLSLWTYASLQTLRSEGVLGMYQFHQLVVVGRLVAWCPRQLPCPTSREWGWSLAGKAPWSSWRTLTVSNPRRSLLTDFVRVRGVQYNCPTVQLRQRPQNVRQDRPFSHCWIRTIFGEHHQMIVKCFTWLYL